MASSAASCRRGRSHARRHCRPMAATGNGAVGLLLADSSRSRWRWLTPVQPRAELERVMGIEPTLVAWEAPSLGQVDDRPPLASGWIPGPPTERSANWAEFHAGTNRGVRRSGTFRMTPKEWSGRRESNPRLELGKLRYYHYTTPASCRDSRQDLQGQQIDGPAPAGQAV